MTENASSESEHSQELRLLRARLKRYESLEKHRLAAAQSDGASGEERLRLAASVASDLIYEWDVATDRLEWHGDVDRALGYEPSEFPRTLDAWIGLIHPEDRSRLAGAADHHRTSCDPIHYEYRIRHRNGTWLDWSDRAAPILDGNGRPDRWIGVCSDDTERKKTEKRLSRNEAMLRSIFRAAPIGIGTVSERVVRWANDELCRIVGYDREELLDRDALMLYPDREEYVRVGREKYDQIRRFGTGTVETVWKRKDGRLIDILLSSAPIEQGDLKAGVTFTALDVTDRKRAEKERHELETKMRQAQKLESLGVLAGGIAHDFNNLLVGIIGNVHLALENTAVDAPGRDTLLRIDAASQRAADLTRQMLAYSGKGRFLVEPVEVSSLFDEMSHLLHASIPKKVSIQIESAPGTPNLEGDATQIRQVLMNLITNAADAIGDNVGVISLRTGTRSAGVRVGETPGKGNRFVYPPSTGDETGGERVFIEVADTGCGMDESAIGRMFDPFFTTKFTGRGLGLSAALGIVRSHKGSIEVWSEPGEGTVFTILLPPSRSGTAEAAKEKPLPAPARRATGTVLVVDDEDLVRDLVSKTLELAGFRTITARDGVDALEIFRKEGDAIDVALVDMLMPRLGGVETVAGLRKIRPDIPVLLSSGYTREEAFERFGSRGFPGFIQKPFLPGELVEAITEQLVR